MNTLILLISNIKKGLFSHKTYAYLLLFIANTLVCNSDYSKYYFSKDEYEHYMKLAKEINPEAYKKLRTCEAAIGRECIAKAVTAEPEVFNEETYGYPVILLRSMLDSDEEGQKNVLNAFLDWYNIVDILTPITPQERNIIMEAIKSVDPTAYEAIASVDPTGEYHIARYDNPGIAIGASTFDGLPFIYIDANKTKIPFNQLRFAVAHELAHYVMGHFTELYKSSYQTKKDEALLANAYNRVKENEADRIAALDFGVDIDSGIADARRILLEAKEHELKMPHRETFKSTHPLWMARIQHLESLRRDVEIYGVKHKTFNWRELAQNYLQWNQSH